MKQAFRVPIDDFIQILNKNETVIEQYRKQVYGTCENCGATFVKNRTDAACCCKQCNWEKWAKEHPEDIKCHKRESARKRRNLKKVNKCK